MRLEILKHWVNIINTALFECEIMSFEQFYDIYNLDNTHLFIGLYNDVPASACMTIHEDYIADLDMVATLKEYRNKGLATAVINKAIVNLHNHGIKTVSLRAEPDGINLYKKIGFREYCKRVVASCDWKSIFKKTCPCHIESETIQKANLIYKTSTDISAFVEEMQHQGVIGQKIWYNQDEKAIYITKRLACDCGSGCPDNNSLIGQRCHCHYFNQTNEYIPITYCKCSAEFFRPMFEPIFGDGIVIEPVETVLSGGEKCTFAIIL